MNTKMKSTIDVLMSRLRMKQLQLLIALDDHKSLHKASSAMAMTQSAASKALAELESMLDATLFERTKKGLVPNDFGRAVVRYARVLATDLASLCEGIAQVRSGTGGRLSIGSIMGAIPGLVAPVVTKLHESHPALSIDIVEDTSARLLAMLDEGHVDLVVGRASVSQQPSKYHYQPIGDEPISVVAGPGHRFAAEASSSLAAFGECRWVTYPTHMPMHALLEREMDLAGMPMPPAPISTASTFVTVALLQQSAQLVSILPTTVAEVFARHGMLTVLPIDLKSRSQTIGVVIRANGSLSKSAQAFCETPPRT